MGQIESSETWKSRIIMAYDLMSIYMYNYIYILYDICIDINEQTTKDNHLYVSIYLPIYLSIYIYISMYIYI